MSRIKVFIFSDESGSWHDISDICVRSWLAIGEKEYQKLLLKVDEISSVLDSNELKWSVFIHHPDSTGQDSIHFRLLMAELIAGTVARRILELNATKPEYKDMDVTGFYRKHGEYMNNFLEIAHRIQIPDMEIKNKNVTNLVKKY